MKAEKEVFERRTGDAGRESSSERVYSVRKIFAEGLEEKMIQGERKECVKGECDSGKVMVQIDRWGIKTQEHAHMAADDEGEMVERYFVMAD